MPGPPRRRRQIEGDRRPCHQSVRSELSPVNGSGSSPVCFRSCCCASSSSLASSKSSSSPPACEPSSAISSISSSMPRSEEHTSELQSLMRISYAVFCLKKKNTKHHIQAHHSIKKKIRYE